MSVETRQVENGEYYSVNQCAEKAGISRIAIHYHIRMGNLKAIRIGRVFAVKKVDFDKWESSRN